MVSPQLRLLWLTRGKPSDAGTNQLVSFIVLNRKPFTVLNYLLSLIQENGDTSNDLMYLNEPVLSDSLCAAGNSYDEYYEEDIMVCAGYINGNNQSPHHLVYITYSYSNIDRH